MLQKTPSAMSAQSGGAEESRAAEVAPVRLEVSIATVYAYTNPGDIRGRRYCSGAGAQRLSRRSVSELVPDTYDLDIENCCFSITYQLVQKLEPMSPPPDNVMHTLESLATKRDQIISHDLKVPRGKGKYILSKVFNGGTVDDLIESLPVIAAVRQAGRCSSPLHTTQAQQTLYAVSSPIQSVCFHYTRTPSPEKKKHMRPHRAKHTWEGQGGWGGDITLGGSGA